MNLANKFNSITESIQTMKDKSLDTLISVKKNALIGLGYEDELTTIFSHMKNKEFKKALTEILNLQQKLRELNTGAILLRILNETETEIKKIENEQKG